MIMIIIIIAKIMHALIQAPSRANGASSATIPATASAWRSGRRSRSEAGGGILGGPSRGGVWCGDEPARASPQQQPFERGQEHKPGPSAFGKKTSKEGSQASTTIGRPGGGDAHHTQP